MCCICIITLIARFMGSTWGPSGADRAQMGPMLAPWTLLSGKVIQLFHILPTKPLSKSHLQYQDNSIILHSGHTNSIKITFTMPFPSVIIDRWWNMGFLSSGLILGLCPANERRRYSVTSSSQWETLLLCNVVSHWLGTNLESSLLPHECQPYQWARTSPSSLGWDKTQGQGNLEGN